jgi:hypothetical protein
MMKFLFLLLVVACVNGFDFNKPHSHRGKVTPFKPGRPEVKLTDKDYLMLGRGESVKVRTPDAGQLEECACCVLAVVRVKAVVSCEEIAQCAGGGDGGTQRGHAVSNEGNTQRIAQPVSHFFTFNRPLPSLPLSLIRFKPTTKEAAAAC